MSDLASLGPAVVDTCRRMVADNLVVGTSGNVSARCGEQIVITPTGVDYRALEPEQLPVVTMDGTMLRPGLVPSSELPLHLAAYRAHPDANAVLHTHAAHATAVSTLVEVVPNIHYALAVAGGPVRVARYATYGTEQLAEAATEALRDCRACLLANHGTLAVGSSLTAAYDLTAQLEWACRVWLLARSAGSPNLLSEAEMERVGGKLRTYGQPAE